MTTGPPLNEAPVVGAVRVARVWRKRRWRVVAVIAAVPILIVAGFGAYLASLAEALPWQVDPTAIPVTPFSNLANTGATPTTLIGPDGELYALEMTTNNTQETMMQPGLGRVMRQTGPDSLEPVVTGLTIPVSMEFGPDGALYVSSPAVGANDGTGTLLQISLDELAS